MNALRFVLRVGVLAVALLAVPVRQATAEDASPWYGGPEGQARLIAGNVVEAATRDLRAGVEIKLASGWKTYWRYPGDSGVPPRFDFARSDNVAAVTVLWPAPHAFTDDAGTSIGYKNRVIFPLRVTPRDPRKPVTLRLDLDYGVCEKLCIPAQAKMDVNLTGESSLDATLIQAQALIPKRAALAAAAPLSILSVRREADGPRPRVVVDVAAPPGTKVELFAEGPTPDWALPVPKPIAGAPAGQQRFAFDLDGLPSGATTDGVMLTLTAAAGEQAIELSARLD